MSVPFFAISRWEACKKSSVVAYGASEEEPEVKNMNEDKSKADAEYTVW